MSYNKTATFNVQAVLQGKDKGYSSTMKKASVDAEHLNKNMHGLGLAFQKVGMSGIGRGFGDLKNALRFLVSGNISQGMSSIGRSLEGFNSMGGGIVKTFAVAAAAIGGFIAMGVKGIQTYAALGASITKIGFVSGINPEAATNLYAQFKMTGVDAEAGAKAIAMFTKNLYKARSGVGAQAGALKDLGVKLKTSSGEWKTASELLPEVRDRLSETKDSSLKAGVAMALFSRGWQVLGRWISTDEKLIQSYNDIVKKSGFKFDKGGYEKFIQSQRKVSLTWALMWAQIGKIMSPAMTAIAGFIGTWGPRAIKVVSGVGKAFGKAFGFLGPVPALILALGVPLGAIALIFTKSVQSAQAFKGALKTMGWAGETAAIDADTAALVANNAARAGGSLGGMGAPYASPRMNRQADLNAAFKAQDLSAMQKAGSAAGLAPTLGTIGKAEQPVSRLGIVAAKTGGAFRSLGAGIASAAVSFGPFIIAAAAAGAAFLLVRPFYREWKDAEKQAADATKGFADAVTLNLERIADKFGVLSDRYQEFADLMASDVMASLDEQTKGPALGLSRMTSNLEAQWKHLLGEKSDQEVAKAAGKILDTTQAIFDKGPLTAEGKKKIVGAIDDLKGLGTIAAPAVALLSQQLLNIDPSALDDTATKAKKAKEALKAAADALAIINVQIPGMSGPVGMSKSQAVAGGWMGLDKAGTEIMLKGATIVEDVQKTAAETAAAGADLTNTLASIPKNIIEILNRDWAGIGAATFNAMIAFNSGFASLTDELVGLWGTRMSSLASITSALGSILSVFADAPKKALRPLQQNFAALGVALFNAMMQVNAAFAQMSDEMLVADAARMGSIGTAAGGIGSFISALADMPKKAVRVIPQAWHSLAATLASALSAVLSVFTDKGLAKQAERAGSVGSAAGGIGSFIGAMADMPAKAVKIIPQAWKKLATVLSAALAAVLNVFAATSTKGLAGNAERIGSIGSAAGGIGSFISALADLPDKAVKIIPQKWKALAKVVKSAVDQVLAVFKKLSTKQLGDSATRAGSVAGMAGSLGSIISMFVEAPDKAVAVIPQKWHSLAVVIKKAVEEVLKVYKDMSDEMLGKKGDRMGLIGAMVGPLGDILSYFANAPKTIITTMRQNWAAFGTAMIEGVGGVLKQFAIWDDKMLKSKSEKMGFIGTMVSVIGSIADLAASLPDMAANLQKFATMTYGNLWQGIGSALTQMINGIVGALHIIPDATKLQTALDAVTLLRDIFASMVEVSANSVNAMNTAPVPALAAVPAMASTPGGSVDVNVSWQTLTGEPSEREKRQLVRRLKPEFTRLANDRKRTGF